jgi:hypothetical protein
VYGSANGRVKVPSELQRKEDAGNGGGEDIIHSRHSNFYHPFGLDWTDTTVAGQSATQAELELAVNWDRIWDRKHIPMAFLQVND